MITALAKVALRSPTTWRHGAYRVGLFCVAVWLIARALIASWHFTIDDSGISYAYAKHLASGLGPVAAPGAPWVEGYSNALWVFALTPFHWLSLPLAGVSKWLGVLGFTATLGAGVWLLIKEYGLRVGTAALAAGWMILLGTCVEVAVWVVAGLENALLGALLLGLAAAERAERERPERFPWSSALAFGLCITRPEGIMYAAPVLALKIFDAWRSRVTWRWVLRAALYFCIPLALYHVVHFAVFHEWVPNTYFAKPAERSIGRGFAYLAKGLRDTGLVYLVPLALIGSVRAVRSKLPLIWFCIAGVTFIVYSGGDWMPYSRFVAFFAPPLVLLAVHGIWTLVALATLPVEGWRPHLRALMLEGGLVVVLASGVFFWNGYHGPRFAKESKSKFCHFCQRTADAEKLQKVSKDAKLGRVTVLTHDFGGPSWQADDSFYPIDFLGLCDASVARIRREQDRLWANTLLSPYLFHEQPHAPTWIYLPKNFWRSLKELPEYRSAYYSLSSRLLPHAPGGSYMALNRGQLVDYFAPVEASVAPLVLSPELGLSGAGWFAEGAPSKLAPGTRLRVVLSVVPRQVLRGTEALWVELSSAGKTSKSEKVSLSRGLTGLAPQLLVGEPLRVEVTLTLPELPKGSSESALKLAVGVANQRGTKNGVIDVASLVIGSELPAYERTSARLPSGLPVATSPELVSRRVAVATSVERQHLGEKWQQTSADVEMARELRNLGDSLVSTEPKQAYLAYVWATQLDARQWEGLTKPLLALRQPIDDASMANELALLRDYYASQFPASDADRVSTTRWAERLVAFYTHTGDTAKAAYFARRAGVSANAVNEPWSWSRAFEDDKALDWTGDRSVFSVERPDDVARKRWRGLSGSGYLTSRGKGEKGKGTLTSPEFTLNGERLSFAFGGSTSKDVGVELLVDGAIVKSIGGSSKLVLQSVWWDVTPWFGKAAQLRVYDKSSKQIALLDEVLLWH